MERLLKRMERGVDAVDDVVGRAGAAAVYGDEEVAGAVLAGGPGAGGLRGRDTGRESRKLKNVSTVEGKIVDLLLIDDRADGCFGRLQRRGHGRDFDGLRGCPDTERDGGVGGLIDEEIERGDGAGLEARLLDGELVVGRRHVG